MDEKEAKTIETEITETEIEEIEITETETGRGTGTGTGIEIEETEMGTEIGIKTTGTDVILIQREKTNGVADRKEKANFHNGMMVSYIILNRHILECLSIHNLPSLLYPFLTTGSIFHSLITTSKPILRNYIDT